MHATKAGVVALFVSVSCAAKVVAPSAPVCPDLTVDAIEKYDFIGEMKLQPATAMKVKNGVQAALVLNKYASDVDTELKTACASYLKDLGATVDPKLAADPCKALIGALGDARTKLGGVTTISVDVAPPVCAVDLATINECASRCDPAVTGAAATATCEPGKSSGNCAAQCSGVCEMSNAKCASSCTGKCDGKLKGTCSGVCTGRCDSKLQKGGKGNCPGVCEGTCDGNVIAACAGNCNGSCKMTTAATCAGACTGTCSGEMPGGKCTGEIDPSGLSPDCKARCDLETSASISCAPSHIAIGLAGALDDSRADRFKTAGEKNLPVIAKLAMGLGTRIPMVTREVKDMVDGVSSTIKTSIPNPIAAGQAAACFSKPFAAAAISITTLNASVETSINLKASVSGSTLTTGG